MTAQFYRLVLLVQVCMLQEHHNLINDNWNSKLWVAWFPIFYYPWMVFYIHITSTPINNVYFFIRSQLIWVNIKKHECKITQNVLIAHANKLKSRLVLLEVMNSAGFCRTTMRGKAATEPPTKWPICLSKLFYSNQCLFGQLQAHSFGHSFTWLKYGWYWYSPHNVDQDRDYGFKDA